MDNMTVNDNVRDIANKIVNYETKEKGIIGKIFAFDAKDGFFSKASKALGITGLAVGTVAFGGLLALNGAVGVSAAVVAGGSIFTAAYRSVIHSVFEDIHDSHEGNLTKFGHYAATNIAAHIATYAAAAVGGFIPIPGAPEALLLTTALGSTALASKVIGSNFGDQQLRKDSEAARELAQKAIENGLSVDQVLGVNQQQNRSQDFSQEYANHPANDKTVEYAREEDKRRVQQGGLQVG